MHIITRKLQNCLSENTQGFQRAHIFNEHTIADSPLSLEYVVLPTGAEAVPHAHINTHTIVFTIQGGVRIYYGKRLEHELIVEPFESVYIPPDVIHHVINERAENMVAVVARTRASNGIKEYPELLNKVTYQISAE